MCGRVLMGRRFDVGYADVVDSGPESTAVQARDQCCRVPVAVVHSGVKRALGRCRFVSLAVS